MRTDGWNHNAHYHDRLLAAIPRPCGRVLDIGCGRGGFTRRLAAVATQVDAIDRDAAALIHARADSAAFPNIRFIDANFLSWTAEGPYDAVTMVATLHHLPFDASLRKATSLLRDGGTLVILGLHRTPFPRAAAQAVVAVPVSRYYRFTRPFTPVGAPLADPEMTLEDIRGGARALLPGAVVEEHLLWRYSLIWRK